MKPLAPLEVPLDGVQLIEASAGTGKTYTITTLFLRLLLERQLTVQQIVVVTFTKAATAELRGRVRKRLHEALLWFDSPQGSVTGDAVFEKIVERTNRDAARHRLSQALQEMDEASIFTIHGFCQRMLLEYAFESKLRFDLELLADQRALIQEIVQDFWAREVTALSEAQVRFLQAERVNLKDLVSLAYTAISWPHIPIVREDNVANTQSALNRYLLTRSQAAAVWATAGADVQKLLRGSVSLNRRSYKPETLSRWFEELDQLLASPDESLAGYTEAIARFSRSTLVRATNSGKEPPQHRFFETCEWLQSAHADCVKAFENWLVHFKVRLSEFARAQAQERKLERGLLSFDDLLQQMSTALRSQRGEVLAKHIREKYPAALIDEFQDTDPVQYAVFSRIYQKRGNALFLIGDPKQAIYGFRGADIFAYLKAVADAGGGAWTLDTNYRSDRTLIHALNTLFERPHRPFLLEEISYVSVKPRPSAGDALGSCDAGPPPKPFEILFVARERLGNRDRAIGRQWSDECLPSWIAADVARLLDSNTTINQRQVKPSDIAVLTRTNAQAREIGRALGAVGIPSALVGDTSVFDTPEAQEMRLILRAMAEPTSAGALRSALCTESMGVSAAEIANLSADEGAWEGWVDSFRELHERWEQRGFVHAMQALLRRRRVSARTLTLLDGERRMTNLRHLMELLHQAETDAHLGMSGLLSWFDDVVFNPTAREGMAPDAQQIRLESDDHAVQLTTMHKSKGLEYGIVYCPYLWRDAGLFPQETKHLKVHDASDENRLKLDLRTQAAKRAELAAAGRESLAENLRLLYVALTRAKHQTVLVWGAFNRAEESPLGYLLYQAEQELGALSEAPIGRIANRTDKELTLWLKRLEVQSNGAIGVRMLEPEPAPLYTRENAQSGPSEVRKLKRRIDTHFRISSFSQLTKAPHQVSLIADFGKDVDEASPNELPTVGDGAGVIELSTEPVLLGEFPRGARVGELLHGILEHSDFDDTASLRSIAKTRLERHGLAVDTWLETVVHALTEVLATPLPGHAGLRLNAILASQRVSEMEFTLPVQLARDQLVRRHQELVTVRRLASVFERYGTDLPSSYAGRLAQLGFAPLIGFLRGFIDLVFEYDDKYFVVDFKSNHLGASAADYAVARLTRHMQDHHYYLQYHLYVTALHHHLKARRTDYTYEQHFGGVYYLFLRGMSPRHPPQAGIYHARPEQALILALSDLFDSKPEFAQ